MVTIKFSIEKYEKIKRSYTLSETTVNVMHYIDLFGKCHDKKDEVKTHMIDDILQMAEKDTYGMF